MAKTDIYRPTHAAVAADTAITTSTGRRIVPVWQDELMALVQTEARLREVLVEMEWHDNDCCPWCGRSRPDGHNACDLADALALAEKQ